MKSYLIIDKFIISRELIYSVVCKTNNDSIVYQAESFDETKNIICQNGEVDFLIFNPVYLQLDSNECIKQLKHLNPQAKVLVISDSRKYKTAQELVENGADIIISINSTKEEICTAIRNLVSGQSFRSESLINQNEVNSDPKLENAKSQASQGNNVGCNFKLTKRQKEVLDYVTKGYANKLIAYKLGVSEGTVKLHVSSILRALKVTNRTEAAMRAGHFMQSTAH